MSELLYDVSDHIATLTFNRPDQMNTISGPMLFELSKRLIEADRDPEVRVIVLTGNGRAFCAGLDIAAQSSGGGLGNIGASPGEFDLRDAPPIVLHSVDTPTVCSLNGGAAGYGMDIALGCDIRIAARVVQARGRVHQARHPSRERRHVAAAADGRLREGGRDRVHGSHAHGQGVPRARARQPGRARHASWPTRHARLALEIAANAPLAVRATKRMMRMAETETFEQNVHHVFLQLLPLFRSEDFKEGMASFLEKRPAEFKGR